MSPAVFALMLGCSSNSSTGPVDASTSGNDSGPVADAGPATDTGAAATPDAASDAGVAACLALSSNACVTCCGNLYPAGQNTFGKEEFQCACVTNLCGALDGGADAGALDGGADAGALDGAASDADAGNAATDASTDANAEASLLGQGGCANTCTSQADPDDTCLDCLRASLGSESSPGACGIEVVAQCEQDSDCQSYFSCIEACP